MSTTDAANNVAEAAAQVAARWNNVAEMAREIAVVESANPDYQRIILYIADTAAALATEALGGGESVAPLLAGIGHPRPRNVFEMLRAALGPDSDTDSEADPERESVFRFLKMYKTKNVA